MAVSGGGRGKGDCHGRARNRRFGLSSVVFIWIFSVTSCRGSTEQSPQDTDPDVPSSTSAVTTETGSDEVFIISAGPGASGLSFTTYRIQVGMLLDIARDIASHTMSFLDSTCHIPTLMLAASFARVVVTEPGSSLNHQAEMLQKYMGCDPSASIFSALIRSG